MGSYTLPCLTPTDRSSAPARSLCVALQLLYSPERAETVGVLESTHSSLRRKVQRADYEPPTLARYESAEPHEAPSQVSLHSLLDRSAVDERP
jgi:hypothetical protein